MGKRRGRGNPKKDPSARRPRPGRARSRGEIPEHIRGEVLLDVVQQASPVNAPLLLSAGAWMLHGFRAGHAGNNCIDGCMTLRYVYELFGIASRIELVQVTVSRPDAGAATRYGAKTPRWNPDGTFDGHAVLVVQEGPFLVDATLSQFPEVPADSLAGQVIPVVLRLPSEALFDGQHVLEVPRPDHTVRYLPATDIDPDLLRHPTIRQTDPKYKAAAVNLASQTVAMLNTDDLADTFPTLPYPRLQSLREDLADARLIEDSNGDLLFRRGDSEIRLTS